MIVKTKFKIDESILMNILTEMLSNNVKVNKKSILKYIKDTVISKGLNGLFLLEPDLDYEDAGQKLFNEYKSLIEK